MWLDAAYSVTVIGRNKRDYVWIMAREPRIDPSVYGEILEYLEGVGYDVARIESVPQRW